MTAKNRISLHPRLAAFVELVVAVIFYSLLTRENQIWLVVVLIMLRTAWWGMLTQLTFYPEFRSRLAHLLTLLFFNFAVSGILFLTSQTYARSIVVAVSIILSAGSFFLIPASNEVVLALAKPERRLRWLMAIVTVAGLWGIIFGLNTFQYISGRIAFGIMSVGVLLTAVLSQWWWYEYERLVPSRRLLGAALLGLIVGQIVYVLHLWPLGQLTNTLLATWMWYVVWMIIRFYFSQEGIRWSQHRYTLSLQLVALITLLIFVVRWQ